MTRGDLENALEDYYSMELERTGKCLDLGVTQANINTVAYTRYGRIDNGTSGSVLCDMIVEALDKVSWN